MSVKPPLPSRYMTIFGERLTVEDQASARVRHILRHMTGFRPVVWRTLLEVGLQHVYVSNRAVPYMDDMGFLHGVAPRGWPPGATWDTIPGTYNPERHFLLCGGGGHGSVSLLGHEGGHAINFLLGIRDTEALIAHHKRLYHKLDDAYYRQDGPGGFAGRDEMFAESVATRITHRRGHSVRVYDERYVAWLDDILAHPRVMGVLQVARGWGDPEWAGTQWGRGLCMTGPTRG